MRRHISMSDRSSQNLGQFSNGLLRNTIGAIRIDRQVNGDQPARMTMAVRFNVVPTFTAGQ